MKDRRKKSNRIDLMNIIVSQKTKKIKKKQLTNKMSIQLKKNIKTERKYIN